MLSSNKPGTVEEVVVPDPDLEIREEGGGLPKNFFRPFRPQFGLKIKGAAPRPLPWISHWRAVVVLVVHNLLNKDVLRLKPA